MIRQSLFIIVACAYILSVTCSLWYSYFLISPTFYPFIVLATCCLCYPIELLKNKFFKSSIFYCLTLFVIPSFHELSSFSFAYGSGNYNTALIESAFILPSVAISAIIFHHRDPKELKYITIFGLAGIVLSLIVMAPSVLTDNSVIRLYSERLNTDKDFDMSEMAIARFFWNYPMCHAIALLFPIYLALSRFTKKWKKVFSIALSISVFYFILRSSIATTIIFSLMCLVIAYNKKNENNKTSLYVIEIILLLCMYTLLPILLNYVSDFFAGGAMELKLQDIASMLQGGDDVNGSFSVRSERHLQALSCFLHNPLLGDFVTVNGHSVFLNRLGSLGLFGTVPFCLMFYILFKSYRNILINRIRLYYYLAFVCAALLIFTKGLFGQEGYVTIFVLVPATLLWLQTNFVRDSF